MSHSLRSRHDDRGVVALEMVLALPLILALIVTSISVAGLLQTKSRVVGAARDGARAAAIKPGVASPTVDTNAVDGITVVLDSAACPALTNVAYQSASPPKVTVKASQSYDFTVVFFDRTKIVTESATMPCG